jgi:hypothetical protein
MSKKNPTRTEKEQAATVQEIHDKFAASVKKELVDFRALTDTEYWFAVCFRTREQKEAFLAAIGQPAGENKYLNGETLAVRLGIGDRVLPLGAEIQKRNTKTVDKRLAQLT